MKSSSFNLLSSTAANIWHAQDGLQSYEWWYFDAISDDNKDAIVVIFLDNFLFSPRYNQAVRGMKNSSDRFPAVAFFYYRNRQPIYRAISEFSREDFKVDNEKLACQIGESRFSFEQTPYGAVYFVEVNAKLYNRDLLKANFEWISVESDLLPERHFERNSHNWNLVVARADVTGKVKILGENGSVKSIVDFRGTGYHDHNADSRWLPGVVNKWYWGRAHFIDSTVVFYHYEEFDLEPVTKLILVKNGCAEILDAEVQVVGRGLSLLSGLYPRKLVFFTPEGIRLSVTQKVIDASFFYLRFLSEAVVEYPDYKRHKTLAISECLIPKRLRKGYFDRFIDMRISKKGRPASLP